MVFTISPHSWVQRNRAQHDMNTNSADAYTTAENIYPHSFARRSNTPFNTAQHNMITAPSHFQRAPQSAHANSSTPLMRATQQTTTVEFVQDGTMHSFNLPIACSPREIESLQELAMNTRFGTINLMSRRGAHITSVGNRLKAACPELCAELEKTKASERIRGGVFDGLSMQEARWLTEMDWEAWTQQSGSENNDNSDPERTEPSYSLEELDARLARLGIAER